MRKNANRKTCKQCGQTKDNKDFPSFKVGGLVYEGVYREQVCYECEAKIWNPIITKPLVIGGAL